MVYKLTARTAVKRSMLLLPTPNFLRRQAPRNRKLDSVGHISASIRSALPAEPRLTAPPKIPILPFASISDRVVTATSKQTSWLNLASSSSPCPTGTITAQEVLTASLFWASTIPVTICDNVSRTKSRNYLRCPAQTLKLHHNGQKKRGSPTYPHAPQCPFKSTSVTCSTPTGVLLPFVTPMSTFTSGRHITLPQSTHVKCG